MGKIKPELGPELMGIHALNSAAPYNAAARSVMFSGHFAQRPTILGGEPTLIQTGNEDEFGLYTFSVSMPEDGTIVKVIPRYHQGVGSDNINFSPETLVIYQSEETGEHEVFSIPYFTSLSQSFGFKYEMKPEVDRIRPGARFSKDTVFADTPANVDGHNYTYSKNLNVCYMSHPNVGLDGYLINRDALKHFRTRVYEQRTVSFGSSDFPLNVNGDPDGPYRIFPEIGEFTREDGLLMATRRKDPFLAPALLSRKDVCTIDHMFDYKSYVRPGLVGRVVDVQVIASDNVNQQLPPEMTEQLTRYSKALLRFHHEIISFEQKLIQQDIAHGGVGAPKLGKALRRLIVESKEMVNHPMKDSKQTLIKLYKQEPIDAWRVTVTVEYILTPERGFKFTCDNGGKGVVCKIEEPENMPVDSDGNVADIVSGPDSVPGRMNLGRLYKPYFAAAARDVRKELLEMIGYPRDYLQPTSIEQLKEIPLDRWNAMMSRALQLFKIVSPTIHKELVDYCTEDEVYEWMAQVFSSQNYLHMPTESESILLGTPFEEERSYDEMVLEIEKNFKLVYGPVTYRSNGGEVVTTRDKVRIAPLPIMLLDKIADSWLSVDVGKLSNFGVLASQNSVDKYSSPWKKRSPKTNGETELSGLYISYGGRELAAELIDRNGSITSQLNISRAILNDPHPTRIKDALDREKFPLGSARPIQMTKHMMSCGGFRIVYEPEELN